MMGVDLLERISRAYVEGTEVRPYGSAYLVYTPVSLEGGQVVTVYVEEIGEDVFNLSDRGQVTDELALAGVDLATNVQAARSWVAVKRSLDLSPAIGDVGEFELSASASGDMIGRAVMRLSETALRAEGLKAFAPHRSRRSFRERVISTAGERGLAVVPKSKLPIRGGVRREVTCRVDGKRSVYVQALSAVSAMEGYDHARSIFTDSRIAPTSKVAAIQDAAKVSQWQIDALSEVSTVVFEKELGNFYDQLAA